MQKSLLNFKLFRLLSILTSKEYNALRRMAESDFFKTDAKTPVLLKILKSHHPSFDAPQLSKEFLHKKLFKKQQYKDKTMYDLFHDAAVLTEEFLLTEELKSNERERKRQLRDIYRKKSLYKDFHLSVGKLINRMENQSTRDETDFLELWEVFHHRYFLPKNWELRDCNADLIAAFEALDRFYVLLKFQYFNEVAILKQLSPISKPFLFHQNLENLDTALPPFNNISIFYVFQGIAKLYNQPDNVENYQKIKQFLFDKTKEFNYTQQQYTLIHLLNFVFFKINNKQIEYYQDANELYKFGDCKKLLETEQVVGHTTFLNVVDTAVGAKDLVWAKDFIEKYQVRLFPESPENAIHYAKASYYFGCQNFKEALIHLSQCQSINQMYYIRISFMYLKTYFELLDMDVDADENFNKKMNTFEQYLNRKDEIPAYRKNTFLNGVRTLKTLYKMKNNPNLNLKEKEKCKKEFLQKKSVAGFLWLKEKMEAL